MKKNIIANFIGRFWSVLSNFIFIPLYISILGLESYSIISFALVINGILTLMDAGLTATLSREFANSSNSRENKIKIFRTLETCYLIILVISITLIVASSKFIAFNWLNLKDILPVDVSLYLKIIGFEVGFRLIGRFYSGGFIGLERQVKANVYEIVYGITRNGLILIPLYFYPSLKLFFLWQAISTVLFVIIIKIDLGFTLHRNVGMIFQTPKIEVNILKRIWKFAGGMMLISLVAGLNGQMDKLALSKLLSIEALGLYTLAFALSNGLNILSTPISTAILPRMTALFTDNKKKEAIKLFSKSYMLVSILIFSFSVSIGFFAEELLWIWTNNSDLAKQASIYIPWIAIGMSFLALQNLPFNVVISNGFTKYNNILGIASLGITMPGYWILTKLYGGVGAALTFAFVQVIITIIYLFLVNRRFLNLTLKYIYIKNFIAPIIISLSVTFVFYKLIDLGNTNRLITLVKIGGIVFMTLIVNVILLIPISEIKKELITLKLKYLKRFI